jgi:hypothetical protein
MSGIEQGSGMKMYIYKAELAEYCTRRIPKVRLFRKIGFHDNSLPKIEMCYDGFLRLGQSEDTFLVEYEGGGLSHNLHTGDLLGLEENGVTGYRPREVILPVKTID